MVRLEDWTGLVHGRPESFEGLTVIAPAAAGGGGSWSSPFRVTASDGCDYFVKSLEACPSDADKASLATEQIIAKAGRLIGAPVCETSLISMPDALVGWRPRPDRQPLQAGIAHASQALEHADERGRPTSKHAATTAMTIGTWGYMRYMTGVLAMTRSGCMTWTTI